jgi:23S rRNA (uracil1939-C5)-methyltransferase
VSAAQCIHFGDCGGCHAQDVPYPAQVIAKQQGLEQLFAEDWTAPVPVAPSPATWHYRNKIDPTFAPMQYEVAPPKGFVRETVLGYKRKGRWFWPLDIEECLIAPEGMRELFASVRAWYRERGYRAFNSRTGEGALRNLLVREGKHTGERMAVLLTTPGDEPYDGFVEAVQRAWPCHSIQHGTSASKADVALCDEIRVLHGAPYIREELRLPGLPAPLRFQISPMSFFQTNTRATEGLYGAVRDWVRGIAPRVLYDLYGGMGGIAMSCADLVEEVQSVESVEA